MSELEPLPPDMRELFAEERAAYVEDAAAKARVMRRIEVALAFTGVAAAGAAGAGAAVASSLAAARQAKVWLVLSLATGVVVGEIHGRHSSESERQRDRTSAVASAPPSSPAPPPAVSPTSSAMATGSPPSIAPAIAVSALPAADAASATGASPAPKMVSAPNETSDLAGEQRLIDTMRSALARGRGDDALRAAGDHGRRYARGKLAEEREMLAVQALLLTGDRTSAESRAARFRQRYPDSMFRGAVDSLLAGKSKDTAVEFVRSPVQASHRRGSPELRFAVVDPTAHGKAEAYHPVGRALAVAEIAAPRTFEGRDNPRCARASVCQLRQTSMRGAPLVRCGDGRCRSVTHPRRRAHEEQRAPYKTREREREAHAGCANPLGLVMA